MYRVCTPISLNRSDLEPFDNQWASNDEDDDQDVVEKSHLGKYKYYIGRFLSLRFFLRPKKVVRHSEIKCLCLMKCSI